MKHHSDSTSTTKMTSIEAVITSETPQAKGVEEKEHMTPSYIGSVPL